jgi:phospholipid transport system substrate-binding protein
VYRTATTKGSSRPISPRIIVRNWDVSRIVRVLLIVGAALCTQGAQAQASPVGVTEATPMARVKHAVGQVVAVLRQRTGTRDERWAQIAVVVQDNFDFDDMSQRVLATQWRRATPEERRKFSDYFAQYLEVTLRRQIEAYNDHRIDYVAERIRGGKATVETLVVSGKVRTPVTYKLAQGQSENTKRRWLAYDVVVEGVSLVANYRNTFAAIAKSEGLDGLIADVQRRVERHRRKHGEPTGSTQ